MGNETREQTHAYAAELRGTPPDEVLAFRMQTTGDFITLEALLKASGPADGGSARLPITDGQVRVNGDTETRRGRKLRAGDEVSLGGQRARVQGASAESGPRSDAQQLPAVDCDDLAGDPARVR